MASTKKIKPLPTEEKPAAVEAAPVEIHAEKTPTSRPIVQENYRVVRTWTEKKAIDDIEPEFDNNEIDDDEPAAALIADFEDSDPIASAARAIGGSRSAWSMTVARLPRYSKDERTDSKSRVHVATLQIPDADYLLEGRYIEEIQARFAKGNDVNWFIATVRENNKLYKHLPPFAVEPPDPAIIAAQNPAAQNPAAQISFIQPQSAEDGFKKFAQQARQFAELRDLLFPQSGQEYAQPQRSREDDSALSTERALLHLISQDEKAVDGIVSKLLRPSGASKEISWMELVFEAVRNDTLPKMIREAKTLLETAARQNAAGLQAPPPAASPAPLAPFAPPPQPAAMPTQPQPAASQIEPHVQLLNFTVQSYLQKWPPETASDFIVEYEAQYPAVTPYISAFLALEPAQAAGWIALNVPGADSLANDAGAHDWIAKLQSALKSGDDDGNKDS